MRFLLYFLLVFSATAVLAQRSGPTRFENEVLAFERTDSLSPVAPGAIVFTGSSSVRMWKTLEEDFPDRRVINRGFGGSTFPDLLHYADRLIFAYQPSAVFVYEGDNDINDGASPKAVLKHAKQLRKMIARQLGKEVPVVFISPKPSLSRWQLKEKYEKANALLKAYADKHLHTYYADVWTPALQSNGQVRDDIFIGDNLHMNAKGYDIWRAAIGPVLEVVVH